jgi:hypothetical protein
MEDWFQDLPQIPNLKILESLCKMEEGLHIAYTHPLMYFVTSTLLIMPKMM